MLIIHMAIGMVIHSHNHHTTNVKTKKEKIPREK